MISVLIKSAEKFDVDARMVRKTVEAFLKKWRFDQGVEVSVFFASPVEIRELNKNYRKIDQPTTVLTFSQQSGQGQIIPDEILRLGDLVICPEIARKQSLEISFLLRHGLKNLLSEISTTKDSRTRFS